MKKIPLSRGLYTIVDDDDYLWLRRWKWNAQQGGKKFYAHRSQYISGCREKGTLKVRRISMHRLIMGFPDGLEVDHINGDSLDNRRNNLRVCTRKENGRNVPGRCKTSKFKGVSWYPPKHKWRAVIRLDYRTIYIGIYGNEKDAARAYDRKAVELHGEFAKINGV